MILWLQAAFLPIIAFLTFYRLKILLNWLINLAIKQTKLIKYDALFRCKALLLKNQKTRELLNLLFGPKLLLID